MNRLPPEERYMRDATFKAFVDMLECLIHTAQYTPTEIREAALFACIRYEGRNVRPRMWVNYPYSEMVHSAGPTGA